MAETLKFSPRENDRSPPSPSATATSATGKPGSAPAPDQLADPSGLDSLRLELLVRDPESVAALAQQPAGEARAEFALAALRIGVLALRQARGQLDANAVERECQRMLTGLQAQLDAHDRRTSERLSGVLRDYFDPETGRFNERVKSLVRRDGELEQTLRRLIGVEDSELCRTLLSHVGQESPLMKLLSPTESEGLLQALSESVEGHLATQREVVLAQFSLDNKEGALARLVGELTTHQGKLSETLQGKIDNVVREFSLDEENSALSRLVRNVSLAQQTITSEFSLDNDRSALSRLKTILEGHALANQQFQTEVKETLAKLSARREADQRSTRHGIEFEDVVLEFISRQAQQAGDVAEPTGSRTGLIKNCKHGDCVVELGPDSAASGARIVVEAKDKESYDVKKALAEIESARQNRAAQVGLFVYSRSRAPEALEPVCRYGHDVLVVWDAEDPTTDVYLKVGLTLAKALCVRTAREREHQAVDFSAVDGAILEVAKRAAALDEIRTWTGNILRDANKITDKVELVRAALDRQVGVLEERVADLKQSLAASDTA